MFFSFRYIFLALVLLPLLSCGEDPSPARQNNAAANTNTLAEQPLQQAPADQAYQEGRHYFRIGEPKRSTQGKVEVLKFFWFGCPHCFATEPYAQNWNENKPEDANLIRVAAPLSGVWGFHAQVYYTNKVLGISDQVRQATYDAIHRQGLRLNSLDQVADFYQQNFGIDPQEYKQTFASFSVDLEVKKAIELLQKYQINSVPTFVVGEAFRVNAESAGSVPGIFNVIDHLVRTQF